MAVQTPKTYAGYDSDILTAMINSGINQLAPGGKARALCDIVANKLGELEAREFLNLAQTLLPFATDTNLDVIGEIYGVTRIQAQAASVDSGDQNFCFYVKSGTFGDINNGQDIIVPSGVQITTASTNGPVYLTAAVTLSASSSQQFFSANSLYSGGSSNAPSGVFNFHNFTGYAQNQYGSLLVTNEYGITGGCDLETDADYQYRIHLKLNAQSGVNENALRFAILQVPGIQDVVFNSLAGTFQCYVYAITPVAAASVLSMVQDTINNTVAYPLSGTALNPDLVGISLETTITMVAGSSQTDQSTAISQAIQAAANYINNLAIGDPLIINDISAAIQASSSKIQDVGTPNHMLDAIYIWRSRADGSTYSRTLLTDYTPALGERIVVQDIANAIAISGLSS